MQETGPSLRSGRQAHFVEQRSFTASMLAVRTYQRSGPCTVRKSATRVTVPRTSSTSNLRSPPAAGDSPRTRARSCLKQRMRMSSRCSISSRVNTFVSRTGPTLSPQATESAWRSCARIADRNASRAGRGPETVAGTVTGDGAGDSTVRDWQATPASKPINSTFLTRDLLGSGADLRKFRLLPATMPVTRDT